MNIVASRDHDRAIQRDVLTVAVATGIRWVGWGMAEPLFPVFLFLAFRDYGLSSIIDTLGGLTFLLVLPVAGRLADRVSMRRFLITGVALFFFDGLWALASVTRILAFVILANLIDGIAVASDVVGRATFVRRQTTGKRLGFAMGVQNTIVNLGFVVGALVSLIAAPHVSLAWIFFGIVPTNLAAFCLIWRIKGGGLHEVERRCGEDPIGPYWKLWSSTLRAVSELRGLAGLLIYCSALTGLATFLIPIYAYSHGASLREIVVLGLIGVAPDIFGSLLGGFVDRYEAKLLPAGFCVVGLSLVSLSFIAQGARLVAVASAARIVLVVIGLVVEIEATRVTSRSQYGRLSAAVEGIKNVGKIIGTVLFGLSMDRLGAGFVFAALGVGTCIFSASLLGVRHRADLRARLEPAAHLEESTDKRPMTG